MHHGRSHEVASFGSPTLLRAKHAKKSTYSYSQLDAPYYYMDVISANVYMDSVCLSCEYTFQYSWFFVLRGYRTLPLLVSYAKSYQTPPVMSAPSSILTWVVLLNNPQRVFLGKLTSDHSSMWKKKRKKTTKSSPYLIVP